MNVATRLRLLEHTRLADAADSALTRAENKYRTILGAREEAFADLGHWQHAALTAGDEYQHAALTLQQSLATYQQLSDTELAAAGRRRRAATAARTAHDRFTRAWTTAAAGPLGDGGHRTAADRLLAELADMPLELLRAVSAITVQSSAGKDSVVLLDRIATWAKEAGCLEKVVVVHADLQGADWPGVRELAERQARRYGLRFVTVRSPKTFLSMVEGRGMFPDAQNRLCTATLKRDEAAKLFTEIARALGLDGQAVILNCLGIRAAESPARRRKRHLAIDTRASTQRRLVLTWHAVFDLSEADIWEHIASRTLEYHPVYDTSIPRLSCTYCILAPFEVLVEATRLCWLWKLNTPAAYLDVEQRIGHRFTHKFSLADVVAEARRRHEANGPLTFEPGDAIRRHVGEQAAAAYLGRLGLSRTEYLARFGLAA
ncbi:phosphoadenosine phosphosulfate reductase family protein [Streptomyces sp. NPDC086796]|uniref:phosphoadenosine phosphosulfate reductase domain-containing protein n=1 Tax=Streptomyces sp. NPDC086796 TaxID=3365760 RepID=UPI00380281FA